MDSNITTYSPTVFFVMRGGVAVLTSSANVNTKAEDTQSASTNKTDASTSDTSEAVVTPKTKKVASTATKKTTATPTVNKNCDETKTVAATTVVNKAVVNKANGNAASVIGAGEAVFPKTLIGWIALIVSLLFVVLIVRMIFESNEKRKKEREEAEALRHAKEIQKESAL